MKRLIILLFACLSLLACNKKGGEDKGGAETKEAATAKKLDEAGMKALLEKLNLEGYTKSAPTLAPTNSSVAFTSTAQNAKGVNLQVLVNVHPCLDCGYNKESLQSGYLWIEGDAKKGVEEIEVGGKKAYYVYGRIYKKDKDVNMAMHTIHLLYNNGTNGTSIHVKGDFWPESEAELDKVSKEELLDAAKKTLEAVMPLL
ncbi:MAG: hypothetical protein KF690_06080 [Bacteroidetes bacterium]|nr:hypothetical protein [Bacteroidota bacterium]